MSRPPGDGEGPGPPGSGGLRDDERTLRMEGEEPSPLPSSESFLPEGKTVLDLEHQILTPGDLLAGRFRIVGFLGQGGMGEVYEAHDVELGERLALKTVRPQIAAQPGALARFRREINLARRVTHPNVCRIFDLRRHHPESHAGPRRAIVFLTMELLGGETLSERLARDGRLIPAEALPIVRQICDALAAAHRAGVIHRDFKSANVMLVPTPEGMRAVITDFGLARGAAGPEAAGITITGADSIVGSPSYMAPEQVSGDPVGPAADVYSLGVVLYEMMTGEPPFTGGSALSIAVKRLREPPPPPRSVAPDLPEVWERGILACLAREPGDRPGGPLAVLRSLEEGAPAAAPAAPAHTPAPTHPPPAPPPLPRRRLRLSWPVAAGAVAALLVAAVVAFLLLRPPAPEAPPPPVGDRRSVAVLSFSNLSQEPGLAWLSTALAELLTTDLGGGRELRLIPRETVVRAEVELAVPGARTLAPDTLTRLRSLLGSDLVVLGSFLPAGPGEGGLRLDVSLQETASGETRLSYSENGSEEELGTLVSRLGDRLREGLQVTGGEGAAPARLATPEATRLYAEGLARLRRFDAQGARARLERAVAADPESPLAHSALGEAWQALGYEERSREEARQAFELAQDLSWEERRWLEARYREAARQWTDAAALYDGLAQVFPDEVRYGLRLARVQVAAGQGARALATAEALEKLPEPAGADPRISLAEAEAALSQSDYDRLLQAARRAVAQGESSGARLLVARGRLLEGQGLEEQGKLDEAAVAYREATRLHADAGDRVGEARALQSIAIVLAKQGNIEGSQGLMEEALATYRQAGSRQDETKVLANLANLAIFRRDFTDADRLYRESAALAQEIRDHRGEARALTNLATLNRELGKLEEAEELNRQVLEVWRELGDRSQYALTLNNLALTLIDQEERAEALVLLQEALEVFEEIGDPTSAAAARTNIAEIRRDRGELAGAEELFREALAVYREVGARPRIAATLIQIGDLQRLRGELNAARESFREAQALFQETGAARNAILCRMSLARLALDGGDPEAAAELAGRAATELGEGGDRANQSLALATQARALAATGKAEEARSLTARAAALAAAEGNAETRLTVALDEAVVSAAGGLADRARESLAGIARDAAAAGLAEIALEARLALGGLEAEAGLTGPGVGRARLAELATEAREKGYLLVARRAGSGG